MLGRWMIVKATLACSMAALLVLSACGGGAQPAASTATPAKAVSTPTPAASVTPAPATAPAASGQPKMGGTMHQLTYGADIADWDVYRRHSGEPSVAQYMPMFNTLLEWDTKDTTKSAPSLADSWSMSPDGLSYAFNLHKGITWQDGMPFTADDVVASFDHAIAQWTKAAQGSRTGSYLAPIVGSTKAVDPNTVLVTLKAPDSTFLSFATSYLLLMVPKQAMEANGGVQVPTSLAKWTPMGTGPFKFKNYERGIRLLYERNSNYWKKDASGKQMPYLDALELLWINDTNLQFAAMRTGKIDMWPNGFPAVANSSAAKLKQALGDKFVVLRQNASLQDTMDFNLKGTLTSQKDFRWALNLIGDREEFKTRAYEGALLPGAVLDPRLHGSYALPLEELNQMPGLRQPKTKDQEEARQILAKLGITPQTPANVRIISRNLGFHPLDAQIFANQLRPFGINAKVELYEAAVGADYLARGDFDINPDPDPAYIPDPWFVLDIQYVTKPSDNPPFQWSGAAHDQIVTWMNETRQTSDPIKRKDLFFKLQRFILTNGDIPSFVIGYQDTNYMWYSYVKGFVPMGGIYEGLRHDGIWLEH